MSDWYPSANSWEDKGSIQPTKSVRSGRSIFSLVKWGLVSSFKGFVLCLLKPSHAMSLATPRF